MNRAVQTMALAIFSLVFPAQTPAAEVKVWTSDVVSDETSPDAKMELKPVTLVGARNGSFSGKIVVESTGVIKGVKASVGALTGKYGAIPASNVQIRYAKAWDTQGWKYPKGPDILLDAAPEVAPVQGRTILPVWVTVHVPRETKAGVYDGEVTVQPEGAAQVKVKLTLDVADWTLPDPQDYRTWADYVQSPDTLALEYNVPLWSDKHWELIDRSFRYLSPTGCRVVYVPLICGTNFGNEQSMVRWIQKGENRYEWDYTLMEKYLDSAEKNLGKPKLVVFMVWDICMSKDALKRGLQPDGLGGEQIRKNREELLDKGPRVTGWNPATKEASVLILPRYEDEASKALWQPMFTEVKKRMEQRGLEKTIMLGMMPDLWPNKEEVTFWNDISGGRPWVIHGHSGVPKDVMIGNKGLYKIADIGYAAFVYHLTFNVNPDKGRMYGWKNPAILAGYTRFELNTDPAAFIRELQAFHITGGQRGAGRMGADLWPAVRNKKGERSGLVYSRYPENNWRNLDICDWQLAPGPDGAVATRRLEYFKEGTQVCEARIFLEDALLAADKKAKIGADLAQRCQVALDEHHRAMWKTVWGNDEDLNSVGVAAAGRNPIEGLWKSLNVNKRFSSVLVDRAIQGVEAKKGMEQFVVGWQEREKALYTLAGEVAAKLNSK